MIRELHTCDIYDRVQCLDGRQSFVSSYNSTLERASTTYRNKTETIGIVNRIVVFQFETKIMAKDKKLKTGGKAIHPSSRKAKQISRIECHVGRVVKKRQNTKAKFNNLRDRLQWFKDQLKIEQTSFSRDEIHQLIERYFQRFQNELDQIELKSQIGHRQKTPQHASRKALIETTIGTERNEYETNGFKIPNLSSTDGVKELRNWDGSVRFMSRLKLALMKKGSSSETKPLTDEQIETMEETDDEDE